jgi:hypothetical protein
LAVAKAIDDRFRPMDRLEEWFPMKNQTGQSRKNQTGQSRLAASAILFLGFNMR